MDSSLKMKTIEILLVEDNPADINLTQIAIRESKIVNNLSIVRNGVEAIDFLKKKGEFTNVSRPDLILLDLNLPKKDGFDVLIEIKGDNDLKSIPVVVLSVSQTQEDIFKSYKLHANCYVNKPLDMKEFNKIVKSIGNFWFSIVKLPEKE